MSNAVVFAVDVKTIQVGVRPTHGDLNGVMELLCGRQELSLAEVAIAAGFSDQSQLCLHFKRIAGVTPGHFRVSRIA